MNVEQIAQVQKLNKQSLDAAKIVVAMIPVLAVYPFLQSILYPVLHLDR